MDNRITGLVEFLNCAHSVYHAAAYLAETFEKAGYVRLFEHESWDLVPGGKYYLTRGGTAVVAFRVPQTAPAGFMMSASHADRPGFKVKENFELCGTYTRMAVERYGGLILSTWLDRVLSVAGRVTVETEQGIENRLIDLDRDLLMIPNVAIHMNRQVNDGYKWNPAVDMLPLVGGKDAKGKLAAEIEAAAGGKVLGSDLYLYLREKARVWGVEGEFLSAQGLDDLECAWGCTQGFLKAGDSSAIPVLCVFDSEEVGSASVQGACSTLLTDTLDRICGALGLDKKRMLAQSFMVSADNAHAVHPNHPEFADPTNAPVLGGGIVLKHNANQSYCTDGVSAALFRRVCARAGVEVQSYYNRADLPGGSTLGRLSLAQVSVPTADIGLAQLAMHSGYETAATADATALEKAMEVFYGSSLEASESGYCLR
ncbi:MAG: M18 family aminopeptidase [Eubacteriales bacterium]|nr:M18 family aminopeptidase [Eubacteriales bacterium]